MPSRQDIRALTGIRGFAALWVVVYHVQYRAKLPAILTTVMQHGYLAVDIFFVLSGFIMAMSYQSYFRTGVSREKYLVFMIRRMARIYPLYLAATLVISGLCLFGFSHVWSFSLPGFLENIVMVQGWGIGPDINAPAWSVSTEFGVYLVFPWLVSWALFRRSTIPIVMSVISIGVLTWLALDPALHSSSRHGLDISAGYTPYRLIRCAAGFTLGLAAYRAALSPGIQSFVQRPVVTILVTSILIAAACIPAGDLAFVTVAPLFIVCLAIGHGPVQRFFGQFTVYILGEIAYAMYLIHAHLFRLQEVAELHFGLLISFAIYYPVLIGVSYILFRFYEAPMRQLMRKLERFVYSQSEQQVMVSEKAGAVAIHAVNEPIP